jgi:pimeloyl-ACP methyl ester carboxylesterase
MKTDNRVMTWLAMNAPALNTIRIGIMRRTMVSPARRERALRLDLAATPPAAHADVRIEFEAVADALRPGTRATVQELTLNKRPWPFPLSEVTTPVHLWHGALDRNAPAAFARRLAGELPDATLHISESSGHDVGHDRRDEIVSVLASYAK